MPSFLRTLLCSAVATVAVGTAAPVAQATSCAGADTVPTSVTTIEAARGATLCLLNEQRATAGLGALRSEPVLERAATGYSIAMIGQRVFAHVLPDGIVLRSRLAAYVAPASEWTIGENLGWGERELSTPASMVDAWMNSEGHRRNIMDGTFRDIGIGIVPGSPLGNPGTTAATYTTEFGSRDGVLESATAPSSRSTAKTAKTAKARSACTRTAIRKVAKRKRAARVASCARAARAARAAARSAATRS